MPIINSIASWLMKKRMHQIELFMRYPHEVQRDTLMRLLRLSGDTEWGIKHGYSSIKSYQEFASRVPVNDYEGLKPYIERIRKGEQYLLWPTEIRWFAKSSGTTSDKSKFIPVSEESLEECHFKGGKDMLSIYCNNYPETQLFTGKSLTLAGSLRNTGELVNMNEGDLSAVIVQNLPFLAELARTPNSEIALMEDWDHKIVELARATIPQPVTSLIGVPSWMLLLMRYVLEVTGKKTIPEVWPMLEVFFHGGVNFSPYRQSFQSIMGEDAIHYVETYNASEGFFGIQDQPGHPEMLLMLDYGIFYEFIPLKEYQAGSRHAIPLSDIELHVDYAVVISTNGGLWRYLIGDTLRFTEKEPYRFRISGRTKNFINAFGEELMIDNAEEALRIACEKTGSIITEYSAGPVYPESGKPGRHQWLIEFSKEPLSLPLFTELLDNALKSLNSDYEAKRFHDMIMSGPEIISLPQGTFYNWLRSKNKLGGQYKVPRLSNHREIIRELLAEV